MKIVTKPNVLPVSIEQIKANLNIEEADADANIYDLIYGVVSAVEDFLRRGLITQVREITLDDCFPPFLHIEPFQSLVSIDYVDANDTVQSLDLATVRVAPDRGVVTHKSWPKTAEGAAVVTVQYNAGFGDSWNDVPKAIQMAIIALVTEYYDNPGDMKLSNQATEVLQPYAVRYAI